MPLRAIPKTDSETVPADKALEAVASNYAISHDNADRLSKLQQWLKGLTQ